MVSSIVVTLKVVLVGVSIVTAILGCVSHFASTWVKTVCIAPNWCLTLYKICNLPNAEKCPKISMEHYFVAMVIICCILSTMFLVIDLMGKGNQKHMKTIDAGYHVIAAVLLIIAAIVYFVSTEQIYDIFNINQTVTGDINFRRTEKLVAAGVTLGQGLLSGVIAVLIFKA